MSGQSEEWAEILSDFLIECSEILEALPLIILDLEKNPKDENILNKIFRSIHTIKGSSGFLGFVNLAKFTHILEDLLNRLRRFELEVDETIIDALLESSDALKKLLETVKNNKTDDLDVSEIRDKIELLLTPSISSAPSSPSTPPLTKTNVKKNKLSKGKTKKKDKETEKEPLKQEEAPSKKIGQILIEENIITQETLEEVLKTQETLPKIGEILLEKKLVTQQQLDEALKKQNKTETKTEQTIRVDVGRLDNLMNMVGELVLSRNRLLQIYRELQDYDFSDGLNSSISETINQIAFITGELQMGVMKTRMFPISRVFSKFQRLIRELEKQTGKKVSLAISGEDTELDKTIIEEIADPLIHLIRNAMDHGIETPEERKTKGKPETGHIHLSASHQGNQIVIEIKDDGRGMDIPKIIERALSRNLCDEEKLKHMSRNEILNLIFLPGFSTASKVTDISGRGVGMDVVKNKVSHLKGIIEINTEAEKGSLIRLKLPLTLAIIQVLVISVKGHIFSLPLSNVVESLRFRKEEIYSVDGKAVISFRDHIIPIVYLDEMYGLTPLNPKEEDFSSNPWIYIVIIGLGERLKGIIVDYFIEQEEIVIKSLTRFLSLVDGFSGCTIMGDGKVSLILDIEYLIKD